jgi:hypothetical protein
MTRFFARALGLSAGLALVSSAVGCGGSGPATLVGVGTITVSCIDLGDGACNAVTPCVPDAFPSTPTEFVITGINFETTTGTTATVVFRALGGATPFLGGTSAVAEVPGEVRSDTTICGITPTALVCGVASVDATVEVILESGVKDDSTSGPAFTITFNAPVVTLITPDCVGSLSPTTVTVTGTFFGPVGPVTVRLTSVDGQAIFNGGSTTGVDLQGDVTVADTTITFTSPRVVNNVTAALDPLQSLSDALETADLQVILSNGSCSAAAGGPTLDFARPEGDEARNFDFVGGVFGGLDPVTGLRVPQTIPTTIRVLGTDDAGPCPDPFAPVGGVVQVILSTPTGGPTNAFQLDSRAVGTADFDVVSGTIQSGTEIRFSTPRVRASTSFTPVIRILFEDGTISPVTPTLFTWDAPPAIGRGAAVGSEFLPAISNLDVGGGADVGLLGAEPASTFLGAHSSRMEITGTNFQPPVDGGSPAPDIGPARVTLFDALSGTTGPDPLDPESSGDPARRLGTGNPAVTTAANSAPAIGTGIEVGLGSESNLTGIGNPAIPDYVVTTTTITGSTRLDGLLADLDDDLDGEVRVRVRVVNPDAQVSETNSWDPDGGFVRDMTYLLTHATPVNRTADPAATNNNVSVAIDPTSVTDLVGGLPGAANDFAFPQAPEGVLSGANFGANLCVVSGNDASGAFTFASETIRVSFSRNGGFTWADNVIGGAGGAGVTVADGFPAAATRNFAQVSYDRFGNLWIAYLLSDFAAGTDRVILGRSTTQGAAWAFVSVVNSLVDLGLGAGSLDRTALAVGFATHPAFGDGEAQYVSFVDVASFPNRVFVAGLFTSTFGFTPDLVGAVQVDTPGPNPFMQHARPAVGPGGELYVSWLDFDPLIFPFTFRLMIDSDQDGLFAAGFVFDTVVDPDLVVDGSIPFSSGPRPASVDFGPLLPTPAIAVVRAGTHAGRIVVAYEEFSNSGSFQPQSLNLLTSYSDDFGFSWSTPQALAAPAPNTTAADQFLPALAVDDVTGRVYATWYDTAVSAPAHDLTERWSAASEDGIGWGAPLNLSAATSSAPAADGEFTDYGVHSGLAAYGGYVFAGWADNSALGGFQDAVVKLYQQSFEQAP